MECDCCSQRTQLVDVPGAVRRGRSEEDWAGGEEFKRRLSSLELPFAPDSSSPPLISNNCVPSPISNYLTPRPKVDIFEPPPRSNYLTPPPKVGASVCLI